MANYSTLITDITAKIYENAGNDITGQDLQDVLLEMVQEMGQSGMVCLGIADGNTNPPGSSDSNIFYIAGEGTYSAFGGLTVNAGEIALFIWNGSVWTKQSVTTTDPNKADMVSGATAGHLAGLNASGNLTDSGIPADNVAQQDGYYSTLTAGTAENLVGRGTVLAEYTRRTSGGSADIGTGAATITKVHGNTIAWNQLANNGNFTSTTGWNGRYSTLSASGGVLTATVSSDGTNRGLYSATNIPAPQNHRFYLAVDVNPSVATQINMSVGGTSDGNNPTCAANTWTRVSKVYNYTQNVNPSSVYAIAMASMTTGSTIQYKNYICVDLTLAFGSGNEPTASEFESLFPLNYYAYNTGSLVSLTATGINTTGFNQCVEQPINLTATTFPAFSTTKYSRVFGGIQYYLCHSALPVANWRHIYKIYDLSGNEITSGAFTSVDGYPYYGSSRWTESSNNTSTSRNIVFAQDCYVYFGFDNGGITASTPMPTDFNLNISWSGYRNGEYEAYWDSTLALPITTVTSGGSAVFADGMKSANTVSDELTGTKAVKRVEKVDLGTLSWNLASNRFYAQISGCSSRSSGVSNMITAAYPTRKNASPSISGVQANGEYCQSLNYVVIYDTNYATTAAFTTAMSGKYLYYELATPTEYTLDSELNLGYSVDDFGTEEEVPQNGSTPSTAPIIYDVKYAMNAVDTLRNLPTNYISKDSLKNLLDTMQSAGIFSAYTMTYNAGTEQYTFTITV